MFGTCSQQGMDRVPQRHQHGGHRAQRRYSRARSLEVEALEARNLLSFNPPVNFDVGSTPHDVALADLRRDGVLDAVVTNSGDGTVSVLLGKGDGTFQPAITYPVGQQPEGVAVGDVNEDGIPDLAVANFGSGNVVVLLGNGDGTFRPAIPVGFGFGCHTPVLADFNGDGHLDLAVTDTGSNSVLVMFGTGDGTFQLAGTYAVGVSPLGLAAADLRGNGILDLVTANSGSDSVSVLLGTGDGFFKTPQSYPVGVAPMSVAVAALDAPNRFDIVTANMGHPELQNPSTLSVLPSRGDGTFERAIIWDPCIRFGCWIWDVWPDRIRPGVDRFDLVYTDFANDQVWVVLNNGNYDFTTENGYATGSVPANFAVGDVNGDGLLDLVVANSGSSNVSVLLNDGVWGAPGSPALPRTYATSDTPLQPVPTANQSQPAESQHLGALFPWLVPPVLSSDPAHGSAVNRVFSDLADSSFDDVFVNDLVLTAR